MRKGRWWLYLFSMWGMGLMVGMGEWASGVGVSMGSRGWSPVPSCHPLPVVSYPILSRRPLPPFPLSLSPPLLLSYPSRHVVTPIPFCCVVFPPSSRGDMAGREGGEERWWQFMRHGGGVVVIPLPSLFPRSPWPRVPWRARPWFWRRVSGAAGCRWGGSTYQGGSA